MVSALHQASYLRKKELVALDSGKQTTVGSGGFFVYRQQITRRKKGSQEDPLIFLSPPPPLRDINSYLLPSTIFVI
ncbi:hypothetical protein CRE08_27170 [Escherichia coli]|nr:hypothetical protein [Salmonella enterica subsp. enterica serovar Agona]EEW2260061.1 hypothetical protein [Escherichia coli]EFW8212295.1 hypothetical protein [Shigella sonnei]ECI1762471.1 hypothetical protein [Salmonella enterica subsp. enterica serovar Agona]EFN8303803.1 hypothetical protein [Escherichia coli]